jgi:hypothetical protein
MLEWPIHLLRPFLGTRVLKTGLAVFAAIVLFHWLDPRYAVAAAIPAFLAVQPSVVRSGRAIREQMLGNVAGAVIATVLGSFLGGSPATMALGVIVAIVLLPRLGLMDSVVQAVVMVLLTLDQHDAGFALFSIVRIGAVFGGTLVGYLVNRFVLPPDFAVPARAALRAGLEQVGRFAARVGESLATPEQFAREQVKAEMESIHQQLAKARLYLDFLREDRGGGTKAHAVMEHAAGGIGHLVERLADLHRTVLEAGGLQSGAGLEAVRGALEGVSAYQAAALEAALQGDLSPGRAALEKAESAVGRLEEMVLRLVESGESRTLGLRLHTMYDGILHMLWRVRSIERLAAGGEVRADALS